MVKKGSSRRKNSRSKRTQKLYNMKGCSLMKRGGRTFISNAYPNKGISPSKFDFLNPQAPQRGGCGGTCSAHQSGGSCGCGLNQSGGAGLPYPDGLVGRPYGNALSRLPGVDTIQGNRNFYTPNNYNKDLPTATTYTGANFPFSIGGKKRVQKSRRRRRRQRGGFTLTNTVAQDLVNMGRQVGYGVQTTFHRLNGTNAGPNPMPWIQPYTTGAS